MTGITKKLLLIIPVLAVLILTAYFSFFAPKPSLATDIKKPLSVTVAPLEEQDITETVIGYGQVVSPDSSTVKAQSNGIISSIDYSPGQAVTKGQLLFNLKTSDSSAQLEKLAAQTELSKQIYLRNKQLAALDHAGVSTVDLLKAKLQYAQDLAEYQQAQSIYQIVAPIAGIATETNFTVGDYVNANDILAQIVTPHSLQVRYQLPSRYSSLVSVGQSVIFKPSDSNNQYPATVSYLAPLVSADAVSFTLRADFADTDVLTVNSFGQVIQPLNNQHRGLAIAQDLVQSDSEGFFVYLFKDKKVFKQHFQAGELLKSGLIEVKSGLNMGDLLITSNPYLLHEGQPVEASAP